MRLCDRLLFMICVLGFCAPVHAEGPSYRMQAVGNELQTVRTDEDGRISRVHVVAFPVAIDSVLSVGCMLYVVYAKKYIALFDIENPTNPQRLKTLTANLSIARLGLSADGNSNLLLSSLAGNTLAYSLVNPLQPTPLFGSTPLQPIAADTMERELAELGLGMSQRYRDYGRLHPTAIIGIVVTILGIPLLGGGIWLAKPQNQTLFTLGPAVGILLATSGALPVMSGVTLFAIGVDTQRHDHRLPRPASWSTYTSEPR